MNGKITTSKVCSGCMACKIACPVNCIHIRNKHIGFIRTIDIDKCIHCGKCEKICPMNHGTYHKPQNAYVAWSKKRTIQGESASGGIASTIYEYCIDNDIACLGVKYNEKLQAQYDFVKNKAEIKMVRGSKYVYSHMSSVYHEILRRLKEGEKIVFIGLPCQAAALKNYLNSDCENILYIDIVCHGVCFEKMLQSHIARMTKKNEDKIMSINFRERFNSYGVTIRGKNNKLIKKKDRNTDEYMMAYCYGITYLEACYQCPYARNERVGDITIKDFSGEPFGLLAKEENGLSNILVNTEGGKRFLHRIYNTLNLVEYPIEKVLAEDARLRYPTIKSTKRKIFEKIYPVLGLEISMHILYGYQLLKGKFIKR